jgi:hypothetical protein
MSKVGQPYRCDVCGKLRETDANHWLVLLAREGVSEISIIAWDVEIAGADAARHLCGQACALKMIERELPKLSRTAQGGTHGEK